MVAVKPYNIIQLWAWACDLSWNKLKVSDDSSLPGTWNILKVALNVKAFNEHRWFRSGDKKLSFRIVAAGCFACILFVGVHDWMKMGKWLSPVRIYVMLVCNRCAIDKAPWNLPLSWVVILIHEAWILKTWTGIEISMAQLHDFIRFWKTKDQR